MPYCQKNAHYPGIVVFMCLAPLNEGFIFQGLKMA
jgi:hypothetical protein